MRNTDSLVNYLKEKDIMKLPRSRQSPRNYQIEDALFQVQDFRGKLHPRRLEQGLGKSFICLLWMLMFLEKGPVIIVCPAIIKENWRREAIKHLGRKVVVLDGKKPSELSDNPKAIYVINYDILGLPSKPGEMKTWTDAIARINPQLIVCDEGHRLKEAKAQRSRACRHLSRIAPFFIIATGTPMLSRPMDVWHLCYMVNPELFPNRLQFGLDFCDAKMTMFGWDFRGASNLEKLREILLRNLLVRRLKIDVLKQLPKKVNSVVPFELSRKARKEYDEAVNEFLKWLYRTRKKAVKDRAVMAYLRAERLVKLGYLCRLVGDLKLPMIVDWVRNFLDGSDQKILVGGHQRHVMEKLTSSFNGEAVLIYGQMNRHERQSSIDRFNEDRSCRVLFGNLIAAGVGWSGTSAANVAIAEQPWVPADISQFADRLHGLGRGTGEQLNIHHLLANNTIDLKISETLSTKQGNINLAIDGKHDIEDGADIYDQWIEYLEKGVKK
jgi:SWI/SNF-related matrix-associated actin-dependent regulator 1 of chromatin subfamily A